MEILGIIAFIAFFVLLGYMYQMSKDLVKEGVRDEEGIRKEFWGMLVFEFVVVFTILTIALYEIAKEGGSAAYPIYQSAEEIENPSLHLKSIIPGTTVVSLIITVCSGGFIYLLSLSSQASNREKLKIDLSKKEGLKKKFEEYLETKDYRKLREAFRHFSTYNKENACKAARKILAHSLFSIQDYDIKILAAIYHFMLFSDREYDSMDELKSNEHFRDAVKIMQEILSEKSERELDVLDNQSRGMMSEFYYYVGWYVKIASRSRQIQNPELNTSDHYLNKAISCKGFHLADLPTFYPDKFDYLD